MTHRPDDHHREPADPATLETNTASAATRRHFLRGGVVALATMGAAGVARARGLRSGSGPAAPSATMMTTSGTAYIWAIVDGSDVDYWVAVGLDSEGNTRWASYAKEALVADCDELSIMLRVYESGSGEAPDGLTATASPGPCVQDINASPYADFDLGPYDLTSGPVEVDTSIDFDAGSSEITITLANDVEEVEPGAIVIPDDLPEPDINPEG